MNNRIENGNMFMQWGEPLAIFDSSQVKATEERFHAYLFAKGFFDNKISSTVELSEMGKYVAVSYGVQPGQPYLIDTILYDITDTTIARIVIASKEKSSIQVGAAYDQDKFTAERERIDLMLKDGGYYDFSRQYVEYNIDTAMMGSHRVAAMISIKNPAKRGFHKQFTVDSVNFTPDAGVSAKGSRRSRSYRDVNYHFFKDDYNLKVLSQRVFIHPGEMYNRSNTFNTQRQLANLDAFKFVNINYDTANGRFIANIYTSPLDRYQWSNEAGVNVTQGFPGPFYNTGFKKRNVFGGLETFDLTGRFGFEGVASATSDQNIYKSTEAGINASLTFPQFIWPFRERTEFKLARYNPKTKFSAGYSYTDRPEYRRTTTSLNGTYTWENSRITQYSLTPVNFNVINTTRLDSAFREVLNRQDSLGNFSLVKSFQPSFVNSIIFGVTWNPNNYGNLETSSLFIRAQIESGGTIWNVFSPSLVTDQWGLEYFKYLRASFDFRRNRVLDKNTVLAYRINLGVAYSYSPNKSLPYEKFFFVGGSNSVRAWRPRRLGPGSFKPPLSNDPELDGLYNYSVEQPADILMEGSIELRQNLFGFVDGAVFIDAGNVWTFDERVRLDDQNQEVVDNGNAKFKFNSFYKEIGVGTGFGLRFDFTFLILRFDVGMKVYDPARDEGSRFVLDRIRFFRPFATKNSDGTYTNFKEPVIYNVGIGFPF
ncbi:MAG: BamA/TamA family outer membrane protein [Bacteroidia bacterium]|nr:BamA/TamA family outer membrane protein [Bacteroidia bacterium]